MKGGQVTTFVSREFLNYIGYFIGFIFIIIGIYLWYQNGKIKSIDAKIESITNMDGKKSEDCGCINIVKRTQNSRGVSTTFDRSCNCILTVIVNDQKYDIEINNAQEKYFINQQIKVYFDENKKLKIYSYGSWYIFLFIGLFVFAMTLFSTNTTTYYSSETSFYDTRPTYYNTRPTYYDTRPTYYNNRPVYYNTRPIIKSPEITTVTTFSD
jgi:hypothetical protein